MYVETYIKVRKKTRALHNVPGYLKKLILLNNEKILTRGHFKYIVITESYDEYKNYRNVQYLQQTRTIKQKFTHNSFNTI